MKQQEEIENLRVSVIATENDLKDMGVERQEWSLLLSGRPFAVSKRRRIRGGGNMVLLMNIKSMYEISWIDERFVKVIREH